MNEEKLEKVREILRISTENVSANHWIPAIHEDKHDGLAEVIVKLFAIPDVSVTEGALRQAFFAGCESRNEEYETEDYNTAYEKWRNER